MSKMQYKLLVVDDDPSLMRLLVLRLEAEKYQVFTATNGNEALQVLRSQSIDLVISDLRMDEMDGIELFEQVQHYYSGLPMIILTAQGSISEAVAATQKGVFGFLTKPFDKKELLTQITQALSFSSANGQGRPNDEWRQHILSRSEVMDRLLGTAQQVADSDVSVLISGASGSGKELLAQAIHRASDRKERSFVAINCSALPEPLLESELFGHVKGAFTGAVSEHQGLFRAAHQGTLFLDEIGDMPLTLQVKLLRVLQERQVRPVGSTRSYPVDVRIISATHQDLDKGMEEGSFRQDLYYRLNVVNLKLPDLIDRAEDIPLLANHFLKHTNKGAAGQVTAFSPEAISLLSGAAWPGNVRQLENVVQQTVALSNARVIPASQVRQALADESGYLPSFNEARHQFERDYLVKVMRMTEGNASQAAILAQRNRTDFYKLLQRHGLKAEQFKVA
ncbi:sigma 54-interacting transcriptional regulator [Motiliproteus sp. MSK22-1]|uniref:sigma 54-interacting transcriptional regulator n=1 Tax=Motiliproteus sp. MSK22-1 TaxID=1897630 RepID=UPI000978689F|nr:sigma 54-interacting transcriptional regulator [Motiliproteus sp. MSK22-1]OMH38014.1 two-component system response regulator GlrR [Motiliproteus sp. MSK22-1]